MNFTHFEQQIMIGELTFLIKAIPLHRKKKTSVRYLSLYTKKEQEVLKKFLLRF